MKLKPASIGNLIKSTLNHNVVEITISRSLAKVNAHKIHEINELVSIVVTEAKDQKAESVDAAVQDVVNVFVERLIQVHANG